MEKSYSTLRLFEITLKNIGHTTKTYGKLEQLASAQEQFDVLIIDPGRPVDAIQTLHDLEKIQPDARRLIITVHEDVILLARACQLQSLLMPFSRRLFLAIVEAKQETEERYGDVMYEGTDTDEVGKE